jgi:hypothetical protein
MYTSATATSQPNIQTSASISSVTCGSKNRSAAPRETL